MGRGVVERKQNVSEHRRENRIEVIKHWFYSRIEITIYFLRFVHKLRDIQAWRQSRKAAIPYANVASKTAKQMWMSITHREFM